ncbi:MAG TPA: hypothetical protein VGN12_25135 [Pirellulales bacterium]|jgi:hypothetical protein
MKTEYLLPCQCGQKLAVDRSQAGLSIRCEHCGAEVAIPTLRGLEKLERATPEESDSGGEWGTRQGLLFLGTTITTLALAASAFIWLARPIFPQEYHDAIIDAAGSTVDLDQMSLSQTFAVWKELQQPPEVPNIPEYRDLITNFEAARAIFQRRLTIALGAAACGVAVLGVSLLVPKRKAPLR